MEKDSENAIAMGRRLHAPAGTRLRPVDVRDIETVSQNRSAEGDYKRLRDLPRLVALWPREVHDKSIEGTLNIIAKLRQAMRAERRRGSAGHWSYDLARHLSLARALKTEVASLKVKRRRDDPQFSQ